MFPYTVTLIVRKVIQELKDGNFSNAAVTGILKQAQCILNVADNIMEE